MHALSRAPLPRPLLLLPRLARAAAMGKSSSSSSAAAAGGRDPSGNPTVGRLRELLPGGGDVADGWEKSWESGITPWDLGKPTPIIEHLVKSGSLPKGRALVPGCGMGYDVVTLASPERFVVGLEISNIATEKAKKISDPEGGPPYNNTVADYEKVLEPLGFKAVLMEDNELAVKPGKRFEKLEGGGDADNILLYDMSRQRCP